jgi:hypothetical protein
MRVLQEDENFHEKKNSAQDEDTGIRYQKGEYFNKKPGLKLISTDWRPVHKNSEKEINLRHYSRITGAH